MSNKLVPKIRFAGFDGDWDRRRLGEVTLIIMGQSPSSSNYTNNPADTILVQGNADMKNGRIVPRVWTTQTTKKAEKGDLILSVRAPVGDVGKTDFSVALGRGVAAIRGNEFLYQSLVKMRQNGYWSQLSTGSTFDSINSDNIKESLIMIPMEKEQTAIGNLFQNLDDLITLQQRKNDKLSTVKKSMLEKMFPKDGANVPEIRFTGFNRDWEAYKIGDIASDVARPVVLEDNKAYQLVTVKRRNEGLVSRGFLNGRDILVKSYFEVKAGDYVISKRQVIHGANGLAPEHLDKSVVSNEYLVVVGNDMISAEYWTLISQRSEMYKLFFLSSYGVDVEKMVFNVDDWKKRTIAIPSVPEQNKIVAFFKNLDNLISLHQQELQKLKNIKQSLLDKMFV